jgi:membrane protein involved in D-alanine export
LPGALLLVLPMVLVKASFQTDLIAFAGLSYITFRTIQVYLDNNASEKPANIIDYILFMLFPFTLLIGPIDRFQRFKNDLNGGYGRLNGKQLSDGWQILLLGIVQKFVLAELVNRYWLSPLHAESKAAADVLNNMYAYAFFLYFDFAGYSSMAAGLGKMFGIDVPENFNNPFFAVNPQDFWRRWHITLGDWLREYIFRPYYKWISGKKRLKNFPLFKQNSGLFIIFVIMGLWNGFRGNFILSGCIFGLYSVVHNSYIYYSRKRGRDIIFGSLSEKSVRWISVLIMFNLTCIALYIFSGRCPFL